MKSTIKLFLLVVLFSSVVIGEEGNMGSGGRACTPPATTCRGGEVIETENPGTETTETDSVFEYLRDYLGSFFE